MASDNLMVSISPPLMEALGIRAAGPIDYFRLLGIPRDGNAGAIDSGVMVRSKALREWQTSPQYGREAVRMLSAVHRAAAILKDPTRREAYREEIERLERGEERTPLEEFGEMVSAALADGYLDIAARQELAEFARVNAIDPQQAQQLIARATEEMRRARESERGRGEAPAGWEFRIAGEGEEGFQFMLASLVQDDQSGALDYQKLLGEGGRYGLSTERAAELVGEFQRARFRSLVKRVARGRVVTEAQIRMLMPKAVTYGIEPAEAFSIISDFSLSVLTPEDAMRTLVLTQTFDQEEITQILENRADRLPRANWRRKLAMMVPAWLGYAVVGVIGGAIALWLVTIWLDSRPAGPPPRVAIATPEALVTPPAETNATVPVETPAAPEERPIDFTMLPDPPNDLLAFAPERPEDPPAFEMLVTEVTNDMYQDFVRATLEPAPPGWGPGGRFPAGSAQLPATGITWESAMAYARWFAQQHGFEPATVGLPTHAQYVRALRGRTTRGDPTQADYWTRGRLGRGDGPMPARQQQLDMIYIAGLGQMYDLIGNVAEWGADARGTERAVLGGDYEQTGPFKHLEIRWRPPQSASPLIGFRLVRTPAP